MFLSQFFALISAPEQFRQNKTKNMKLKNIVWPVLAAGLLAGLLTACVSEKQKQAKLEAEAKITKVEAEKTALAKVPNGTVKEGELEKENGKLLWSFDIATPGTKDITEVQVDAITGAVLSVAKESAADEAREKKDEAKEKK
jgi:uncharacterized membrane protein YkoI